MTNPRNYVKDKDDTLSTVNASDYGTGNGANARLRKINLNVDLATQTELNEAFNLLSNAIQDISTGTLSNYYTKPEANEISTALSNAAAADIGAEAAAREEADNAIKTSLSAYALSTTVADAYKVAVSPADEQESSFVYTITQGAESVGTINVPKDMFVEGASFEGTKLILSVRGQDTPISTDLSGLVDEYAGSEDSEVKVTTDGNVISVVLKDTIARVGTSEDDATANTIYGAKAYADKVAAAVAVSAEGEIGEGALVSADDADNMITVGSTQKLKNAVAAAETALQPSEIVGDSTTDLITTITGDHYVSIDPTAKLTAAVAAAETAIQSVAGDNTYLTATIDENKNVTVSAMAKLTAVVDKVETSAAVWDTVTNKADLTALTAEETARTNADAFLSGKIDALSVSLNAAEGDAYVSAYVDGNTVKVEAQDRTKDAINKVEAASANWDAAEQNAKNYADSLSVNYDAAGAALSVKEALISGDGITSADNTIFGAKAYADAIVADSSVTASGDAIVSANADNNAVTVGATDKLSTVVARVEGSAAAWDEVSAKIDTSKVVAAANELSVLSHSALEDYQDIDMIISEVEKIKGALLGFTTALGA